MMRNKVLLLTTLVVIALLASGCGPDEREHTIIAYDDWGRAGLIGEQGDSEPSALSVSPDGTLAVVASPIRVTGTLDFILHLAVIGEDGQEIFNDDLPLQVEGLASIQFVESEDEFLLYWQVENEVYRNSWPMDPNTDWIARFNPELVMIQPGLLGFKATPSPEGDIVILYWDMLSMDIEGPAPDAWEELVFDEEAIMSMYFGDIQISDDGVYYIGYSYQESPIRIYVDTIVLSPGEEQEILYGRKTPVTFLEGLTRSEFRGPIIGLEDDTWYTAYFMEVSTPRGLTDQLYFQPFSRDFDEMADFFSTHDKYNPTMVTLPPTYPPQQMPSEMFPELAIEQVSPTMGLRTSGANLFGTPNAVQGEHEQVILGGTAMLFTNTRANYQPALFYLQDGEAVAYQILTWTDTTTLATRPSIDENGEIYVVWGEATGGLRHYPVYFATTNDVMAEPFQQISLQDTGVIAADTANRLFQSLSLGFFTMMWLAVPFIIAIVGSVAFESGFYYKFFTAAALIMHLVSKFWLTDDLITHIPGLAYVTPAFGNILLYTVPVLTMLISALIWWLVKGRKQDFNKIAINYYLPIGLIDWVLGTIVYAIGFFS